MVRINLEGKRALVTGSSTGIGLATAVRLLEAGAAVTINGRDEGRLNRTVAELRSRLGNDINVTPVAGDVGTREGVDAILNAVGDVDILVHGAAIITRRANWLDYTDEDWIAHLETNILGAVRICRPLLKGMLARGHGRIILISSDSGVTPAMLSPYSVSKTAQLGVARGLAMATKHTNVTVNSVLPGPTTGDVFTQMLEQHVAEGLAADVGEAGRRFVAEQRPDSLLGRPTTPEEVASLIAYLASDEAVGTNGAAVRFDGGSIRSVI